MRRIATALSTLGLASFCAGAQARTAVDFLTVPAGARSSAMGEAYSAVADGADAVHWNPAALGALPAASVLLMREEGVESTALNDGAYAQPLGDKWGAGAAVRYRTVGSLVERDVLGNQIGSITPFGHGLQPRRRPADRVHRRRGDRQVHPIQSARDGPGRGRGRRRPCLFGGWRAALTASNLGGKIRHGVAQEDPPRTYRLGLSGQRRRPVGGRPRRGGPARGGSVPFGGDGGGRDEDASLFHGAARRLQDALPRRRQRGERRGRGHGFRGRRFGRGLRFPAGGRGGGRPPDIFAPGWFESPERSAEPENRRAPPPHALTAAPASAPAGPHIHG